MMKKVIAGLIIPILLLSVGCEAGGSMTIRVGVCDGPYAALFSEAVEPMLMQMGYRVEYVHYDNYAQPNLSLRDRDIDVAIHQNGSYLESSSSQYGLSLTAVCQLPTIGMGVYSDKLSGIGRSSGAVSIPENSTVAIPADLSNRARALRFLEQVGLVSIIDRVNQLYATPYTLSENPLGLVFIEMEAQSIPGSLSGVTLAVVNGNYAYAGGLDTGAPLYAEGWAEEYLNLVVVRSVDVGEQYVSDIISIMQSAEYRSIILDPAGAYSGYNLPAYLSGEVAQ